MNKKKLYFGIAVVFLLGALIGASGTALFVRHRMQGLLEGGPLAARALVMKRLARRLDLSKDQREKIKIIVDETHDELMALRAENQPKIDDLTAKAVERINPILDEQQREKLKVFLDRLKQGWRPGKKDGRRKGRRFN